MLLSVQERKYLPLASMTKFNAKLAICAEEQRIMERAFRNEGDSIQAAIFGDMANYLEGIVENKTVASTANSLAYFSPHAPLNSIVNGIVKQASIDGDKPAMKYVGGDYEAALATYQNPNDADFKLTDEEEAECDKEARDMAKPYDQNITLFFEKIEKYRLECQTMKAMEKVVNAKLRDAGPMLFYKFLPFSENKITPNRRIFDKAGAQSFWIASTSNLTGLDEEIVSGISMNGLINQLNGKTLVSVLNEIRPAVELGATVPQNSANDGLQEFATVITIITLVISAVKVGLQLVDQVEAIAQKKYNDALDPSLISPAEEDFNNDGIADSEQSFLVVNANKIGAGLSAIAGVAGGLLIKDKTIRNVVIAASTVSTTYFGVKVLTNEKRWLVNGERLTAKQMEELEYVPYNGEWYKAAEVSNKSGQSVADILKGGKELYDTISGIFDLIKGESANDTAIFVGNEAVEVNRGDT